MRMTFVAIAVLQTCAYYRTRWQAFDSYLALSQELQDV